MLPCCIVATPDDLSRDKRTYTVVYSNHTVGIIGNQVQAVLYTMETRLAAIGYLMGYNEVIFFAQLPPICLLVVWQDEDKTQVVIGLMEGRQRAYQYGHTTHWQKLFRHVPTHPKASASRHYYSIIKHS